MRLSHVLAFVGGAVAGVAVGMLLAFFCLNYSISLVFSLSHAFSSSDKCGAIRSYTVL